MNLFQRLVLFSLLPVVNQDQNQEHFCKSIPGEFEEVDPVTTTLGKNITLTCITKFPLQDTSIVEWSKGDLEIFTVKDGKEKIQDDESFKGRLCLAVSPGKFRGCNASLNISHVKNSDEGSYHCCIKCPESENRHCTNQTLVVKNEIDHGHIGPEGQGNSPNSFTTTPPQNETISGQCFGVLDLCWSFIGGFVFGLVVGAVITAVYFKRKQKTTNRYSNDQSESASPFPL